MPRFRGPDDVIESFYADNAPELISTAKELGWRMPTATPGVPQTNGIVERRVRIVKTGIRCLLAQSGLHKSWWPYACRATCVGHNTEVDPRKEDGVSPYYRRHGVHPKTPQIPFGVLVDYMPTPNPNKEPAPFDNKTRPGIFVGLHFQPGGKWSGGPRRTAWIPCLFHPSNKRSCCAWKARADNLPIGRFQGKGKGCLRNSHSCPVQC